MSTSLDEQIRQLKQTIAEMETQRAVLGEEAVDSALIPFEQKLAELEAQGGEPVVDSPGFPARQRKLVTLLFMDVVGSTAMTQHLDPEDTLDIMDAALRQLAAPVEAHGGHVTRFMGDGFKAVFGDPVAREDDPEQAIRAGLWIMKTAKSLAQELEKDWEIDGFQIRIGVNTGLVALGGLTEAEDTVMGLPVNLAARIESAAPPGGLLISHNTYRHVRGVFNIETQEPITAKGFPEPVPVYLVKDVKPRAFRVQTRGVEGIETRMVGRQAELKFLQDSLLTAIEDGEGQVVTISGEAGVGKSRLLYEFKNWIELLPPPPVRLFVGRGRQDYQGRPYSLLRDLFSTRFQILEDDPGEEARRKMEAGFGEVFRVAGDGQMRAHIVGQLLGFNFSASPHLKGVLNDSEQLRNRSLMYLKEYFRVVSMDNPCLITLEDIHWADESSLDMFNQLGEGTPQQPLLIAYATRPTLFEQRTYWGEGQTYHTHLELRLLSKRESRQLVAEILKLTAEIPAELRELVVGGAEGNPFYLEELIKMLIENGVIIPGEETWYIETDHLAKVDVPSTLAGVLQARLDRLPPNERIVLQQASVIGRLFWDRLVAHIQAEEGKKGDPQLIPLALTSLRERELVYRREESAFAGAIEYLFKHDVLREVTYESVIKRLRKTYHGLVADWLIVNGGDRVDEYSGLIAEHQLRAGREEEAGKHFFQAGETALASFANSEAESYYRKAIELSPPDSMRADILSGLGETLYRQGDSDRASLTWRKAIDLYRELDDSNRLGDTYVRLSKLLWHSDQLEAWHVCQEGLKVLEGEPDSPGYARLLAEAGRVALFRKETDQIMPLCQRALEMAERLDEMEVYVDAKITIAIHVDDIRERISILEEVIELAEASGLLRSAARAHINLSNYLTYVDINSTLRHLLQAAEISRQISEIDMMMFALNMLAIYYPELGELDTLEEKLADFLRTSTMPESRENEFWLEVRRQLMIKRGEWEPAVEATRKRLEVFRERSDIQQISHTNSDLVEIILEMNRYGKQDDLSEAESALRENLELDFYHKSSLSKMVIIFARQGCNAEARDYLTKVLDNHSHDENDLDYNVLRLDAEFELAFAEEHWSEALAASESLIKIFENSGQRWNWARMLIDLGDALAARNEPGDLERAKETYQQSLDMFTEMGAPGYIKVLEERLENL